MSFGVQIFDASGNTTLDVSNRVTQLIGSGSFSMAIGEFTKLVSYTYPAADIYVTKYLRYFAYSPDQAYVRFAATDSGFYVARYWASQAISGTFFVFRT